MLWSVAMAQTAAQAPRPSMIEQMFPIVLVIGVFYFFIIRPQAKKAKQHQEFLGQIKRGDSVLTGSGILGRVEGLTEKFVTLEISDGVRIKILRNSIAGSAEEKTT
jgi:preprotein translocase subunit YajC